MWRHLIWKRILWQISWHFWVLPESMVDDVCDHSRVWYVMQWSIRRRNGDLAGSMFAVNAQGMIFWCKWQTLSRHVEPAFVRILGRMCDSQCSGVSWHRSYLYRYGLNRLRQPLVHLINAFIKYRKSESQIVWMRAPGSLLVTDNCYLPDNVRQVTRTNLVLLLALEFTSHNTERARTGPSEEPSIL
jgi:hypothetical protein